MNTFLKIAILIFYVLAAVCMVNPIFGENSQYLVYMAAAILVAHVLEMFVAFKWIKLYSGGLATSLLLTLLFGFMHWLPIKQANS